MGGPLSRSASDWPPLSPPAACTCNVRVNRSGLYWNTTTLATGLNGSMPTIAPRSTFGVPGNVLLVMSALHRTDRSSRQRTLEDRLFDGLATLAWPATRAAVR